MSKTAPPSRARRPGPALVGSLLQTVAAIAVAPAILGLEATPTGVSPAFVGAVPGEAAASVSGQEPLHTVSVFAASEADKYPSVAVDGRGTLWLAYVQSVDKRDRIVVRRLDPNGGREEAPGRERREGSWSDPLPMSGETGVESHPRLLVLDDGGLLLLWHARRDGHWGLYSRRLLEDRWGPETRVDTPGVAPLHPRLSRGAGGTVWLAYEVVRERRGRASLEIHLRAGRPGSESVQWGHPVAVHPEGGDRRPALAADPDGGVWIAWDSARTGNHDIFLSSAARAPCREPGGTRRDDAPNAECGPDVHLGPLVQVTADAAFDDTPDLAVDPGTGDLWIVWNSTRTHRDGRYRTDRHLSDAMMRLYRDGRWLAPPGVVPEALPGQVSFGAVNKTPRAAVHPYWHWKQTQSYPRLHLDARRRPWVVWRTDATGAHNFDLWARVYDPAAEAWSSELHLTTPHPGRDEWPSFATTAAGVDWIAWEGQRRPDDADSRYGRGDVDVFNTRDAPTNVFVGRLVPVENWRPAPLGPAPDETYDPEAVDEPSIPGPEAVGVPTADGRFRMYFGDPHSHSVLSDGKVGWPEQILRLARDRYGLDYAVVTDHAEMGRLLRSEYAELQLYARAFTDPGSFVSFTGFEWTAGSAFGHRVVLYHQDDAPHYGVNEAATDDIHELYEHVHRHDGLMSPHHTGQAEWGRWNPEHHDPRVERNFEIASWHGRFEFYGNPWEGRRQVPGHQYQDALRRGYRMGVMAASDTHHMVPGEGGLTAILAERLDRNSLFEAVRARRIYATTGHKIVLELAVNGEPMGSELAGTEDLRLVVRVEGTDAIDRVEVVRDLVDTFAVVRLEQSPSGPDGLFYVYSPTDEARLEVGDTRRLEVRFRDQLADDEVHSYYVRVTQADGQQAWSSPVWATRRPTMPPDPRGTHRHLEGREESE